MKRARTILTLAAIFAIPVVIASIIAKWLGIAP